MKFVKFGIFTLALGMFVASCGNSETAEETTDTMATEEMAPIVEEAPAVDTMAPMTTDSAAAAAPATEAAPAH